MAEEYFFPAPAFKSICEKDAITTDAHIKIIANILGIITIYYQRTDDDDNNSYNILGADFF